VANLKGLTDVRITDVSDFRREAVNRAFPDSAMDPEGRYDLIFESTGAGAVIGNVVPNRLTKKGTLVMIGLFNTPVPFDFNQIVENEWNVCGCAAFSSELAEAVGLLETDWPSFKHIVSHRLALADYQKAFDLLLAPEKKAMKILFEPSKG
jgi:threonine dehydrogenase-like Zn-dependent dehydrogenase